MAVLGRRTAARAGRADEAQGRREETSSRILDATTELLAEGHAEGQGFGDLSIEEITERAGLSRTAFYDYFSDKRELLIKLVERSFSRIFREADERAGAPGTPPEYTLSPHALRAQIRATMRFAREHPEIYCAVVEASGYDQVVGDFWRRHIVAGHIDNLAAAIEDSQATGASLPLHPRAGAQALILTVMYTVYDHVSSGESETADDEVVDALAAICVRAVHGGDAEAD